MEQRRVTLSFEQLPARAQDEIDIAPYNRWLTVDGDIVALFHRTPEGFLLRFPGKADFALARGDLRVICTPAPEASSQLVFDLFHNQIIPLIRNRSGKLVLHASAVAAPAGVLGFVGNSGHGKSTLAASFALAGHPFLTDDGLVLEPSGSGYVATPERAYLRLWPDSDGALFQRESTAKDDAASEKTLVDAGPKLPHQIEPTRVRFLYLLGAGDGGRVSIEPLNPARALSELIRHTFILDIDDRQQLRAHFERLAGVAENVDCFMLDFPRRYEELPRVIEAILAHAETGVCPP